MTAIPINMRRSQDATGKKFGRLTVIGELAERGAHRRAKCRCDCGKDNLLIPLTDIRSGHTKSCGCLSRDKSSERLTEHGHTLRRVRSPEYNSWRAMFARCYLPSYHAYRHYGGRGITVCDRWKVFANFLTDMGFRPENLSLDRIDPNGNYEPGNCRWATRSEQSRNKRKS